MLVAQSRPRNLDWRHAGPLLFGDWGTSRLYVLGLAFYFTAHASVVYLAVMSVIMAAVAWAYTIICRCFPEGGGVYTAARQLNPLLSVIGATLLLCDFIVTAALSAVEGFHYFHTAGSWVAWCAIGTMAVVGVINWFGARNAGRFALVIAVIAILASFVIGVLCVPYLPQGLRSIRFGQEGLESGWSKWQSLVRMVLALSGVEAVANMTGLMKQPVASTAKKTIWPVLAEVILLNLVFGIALNAMPGVTQTIRPDHVTHEVISGVSSEAVPAEVKRYRDTAVRVIATEAGQNAFGAAGGKLIGAGAGIVFGLLLLSAVNTAVMAMVSVLYSLGQDKELPRALTKLNYSGVPWIGLLVAGVAPAIVLVIVSDVKTLSEMYAIGVVGAIAINVCSCAYNRQLPIKRGERWGLWVLGALMIAIEATIVVEKHKATVFASIVVTAVLVLRAIIKSRTPLEAVPEPAHGWMSEIGAPITVAPGKARIMLAARGRENAEYAVDLARKRGAVLFTIFVRPLRVMDLVPGQVPRIENDPQAQVSLGTVAVLAKQAGVQHYPIYVTATEIADEILDYTVTFGCDTLIMGKSRRSMFARAVEGDVVAKVAEHLPEGVSLMTRSAGPDLALHITR